jgi:hypothetical protein
MSSECLYILVGDEKVAASFGDEILLAGLLFKQQDEKDNDPEEYFEFPIDPRDAEYFDGLGIYNPPDWAFHIQKDPFENKIGMIQNQKFFLKKIKFAVGPIGKFHKTDFLDRIGFISEINPLGIYLTAEFIDSYSVVLPGPTFFMKRIRMLLSDRLNHPHQVLWRTYPTPVRPEVDVVCTNRGVVGIIGKNKQIYFPNTRMSSVMFWNRSGEDYQSAYYNFTCEKKIAFPEVDQIILSDFLAKNRIRYTKTVAVGADFYTNPLGSVGWLVIDWKKSIIGHPEFFTKKARILPTNFMDVIDVLLGGVIHGVPLTRDGEDLIYHVLAKFIVPSLENSEEKMWRKHRTSFANNWGLFDHSLVIFPGLDSWKTCVFDEEKGCWNCNKKDMDSSQVFSVCLDPYPHMIGLFLTETDLPADLCRLIIRMTYDGFPEDFRGPNKLELRDEDSSLIQVAEKIELARKMLA